MKKAKETFPAHNAATLSLNNEMKNRTGGRGRESGVGVGVAEFPRGVLE